MSAPAVARPRATVRTYRHGLGDCHLVTLFALDGKQRYTIMIDCGVIIGTANASEKMRAVMDDIIQVTGGKVDLLVATHEHWDHLSGFVQAKESFEKLKADAVWMAWTEDPNDAQATKLKAEHSRSLALLQAVGARLQIDGRGTPNALESLLGFYGVAGRDSTRSALEAVRAKASSPRYCDPSNAATTLAGFGATIYVLGPPRDTEQLKKTRSSEKEPETYTLALQAFEGLMASAMTESDDSQPFSGSYRIPRAMAKEMPFFRDNYRDGEDWRSIDLAWTDDATQFALALDSMTNNTSLVLAIDLQEVGVLLFAADAQVGSWLSWFDCKWTVDGVEIQAADLLARTVLYKVGHHGSHNATLRQKGLDLMTSLKVAVIPVDHDMALTKKWGDIPLGSLLTALDEATDKRGYVLRTDVEPSPTAKAKGARSTSLYFEVDL